MRTFAAALLALVACGDDGAAGMDAGEVDADPNVRGPVTVRVVDKNGQPLAGLRVVFIDTDATVTDVTTDSAGVATGSVYPGASVTAVRARDTNLSFSLTTVQSLVPNDTVTLISAPPAASSTEDPFTQRVVPLPSIDIAMATKSGSTGTFTTLTPHGLATGDRVVIDGANAPFDGEHAVTGAPDATSFTVALGGGGGASSMTGTATKGLPFTFTYPSYSGATSYEIHTPCGPVDVGTLTTATLTLREGCAISPMDVLVYAKTSGTVEAAFVQQTGVAFTAGGNVSISDTWHAVMTVTATYTNPTTRVTDIAAARFTPYVRGQAPATGMTTTTGGDVSLPMMTATPASAVMRTTLRCPTGGDCISTQSGLAQQVLTQRIDGTQASYGLDIGANLLPWVSAVYTPATTTIEVTVTGGGAYDLFEANLKYVRDQVIYTWRVFGPVAGNVTFPQLPSSVPGDPTVRPTDAQSAFQVYLCESDAIDGYRQAIGNVYEALGTCESAPATTVRPFGGTFNRLSQWN